MTSRTKFGIGSHTASQLAFNGDTGKIVWHYQMTPCDVWDYDSIAEAVLADLSIGRKVPALMKADKNGFFYVLNRENGMFLSAEPFVHVTWAKGIDKATGRPIEDPEKRPQLNKWDMPVPLVNSVEFSRRFAVA